MLSKIQRAVPYQAVYVLVVTLYAHKGPRSIYALLYYLNKAIERYLSYKVIICRRTASKIETVRIGNLHCKKYCFFLYVFFFI